MGKRAEHLKKLDIFRITETPENIDEGINNDGQKKQIEEQIESLKSEIIKLGRSQLQARTFAKTEYQSLKDAIAGINGNNDETMQRVIKDLLSIADGLESGIQSGSRISNPEAGSWIGGMKIVHQRVMELLKKLDVQPIKSQGVEFDPFLHNAIDIGNNPEFKDNIVIVEQRRGYIRNGKVIRHAEVIVNRQLKTLEGENEIYE